MRHHTFVKHFFLSFKNILLVIIATSFFIMAGLINRDNDKPIINISKQDSALNVNSNLITYFNFGNKRLLSDLLWIQTLLESDEEHYRKKDLNSWMFLRFYNISLLDPLFYENYLYGGMYLSIVKDDPTGASQIYEKGLQFFENDYKLNYNAGYNYVFELFENEKGIKLLDKIKFHPQATSFLPTIVEKLRYEISGDAEVAIIFLNEALKQTSDDSLKKKIKSEIYALKAETDLNCLNSDLKNCSTVDAEGRKYIFSQQGKWKSQKPYKRFQLNRKNRL